MACFAYPLSKQIPSLDNLLEGRLLLSFSTFREASFSETGLPIKSVHGNLRLEAESQKPPEEEDDSTQFS
jgi:hypothetical protein